MPLINGCKFSCEPCIRGHRATLCSHTDRILIAVRKPGRPLETRGCKCGNPRKSLFIERVISHPNLEPGQNRKPNQPLAQVGPKVQARRRSRVTKSRVTKPETSVTPLTRSGTRKTSSISGDRLRGTTLNQAHLIVQNQELATGRQYPLLSSSDISYNPVQQYNVPKYPATQPKPSVHLAQRQATATS